MKIILTILSVISLFCIAGCVKATSDYNQFVNYHESGPGFILDFITGYNSAQQGDDFGPTLEIMNQNSDLVAAKNSAHFWAWAFVIITGFVYWLTKSKAKI